jgi:RimJ/RimL family protein N-acetyltransferase
MNLKNKYKILSIQNFENEKFSIVPLRSSDRYKIMKWRNEQIYHLRQQKPLSKNDQDNYFDNIISKLFLQNHPNQILFSYLFEEKCIGYGGLVHINWIDKNAELSFIMDTELEKDFFSIHWHNFINNIEKVAFGELKLHKIYVYAFDLRPQLYNTIEEVGFVKEAELKEHCYVNNEFKSVIIHSKISPPCD